MFYERRKIVEKQMENIQKTMEMIQFKCWYYETALASGSEDVPRTMSIQDLPEDVKKWKMAFNQ
jgi:hypothetical protein